MTRPDDDLELLVSRADLAGSVSLNSVMINGSRVVGPIVVAVLRSFHVTIAQIFLINAATYLFVVYALFITTIERTGDGNWVEIDYRNPASSIIAKDKGAV